MEIDFKVWVRCYTYNHAMYILDALNGFVMQQTSFPYICTIVDDASIDGEQDVIRQYLDENFNTNEKECLQQEETSDYSMILTRHKRNSNCYFAVFFLKYNHHSLKKTKVSYLKKWSHTVKYQALCEGDDYWTDPLKLQKQVSFLESHSNVSLCFHPVKVLGEDIKFELQNKIGFSSINDLCFGNYIATGSVVCRIDKRIAEYNNAKIKRSRVGDYQRYMFYALIGDLYSFENEMGVYRVHTENSWRGSSIYDKKKDCEGYLYNLIHIGDMPLLPKLVLKIRYLINRLVIDQLEESKDKINQEVLINNKGGRSIFKKVNKTILSFIFTALKAMESLNYKIINLVK